MPAFPCWCCAAGRFAALLATILIRTGSEPAAAQAPGFVLRGRVLDADTRQPLPHAQVGVGDNRVGTSTNDDGRFVLAVPAAYAQSTLEVALLGYQRRRQPLAALAANPAVVIALRPSPAELDEVSVSTSAVGIVREALARIPQNYPVRPTRLRGFLREADVAANGQLLFVAEATEQVLVPPYTQPRRRGQVQLEQSRKVDLRPKARLSRGPDWAAGPFVPLRFDFVRIRAEFLQPARFASYTYRVTDLTSFHGEEVYVIRFAPRPGRRGAHYAGTLYIGASSYAFIRASATRLGSGGASLSAEDDDSTATTDPAGRRGLVRSWTTSYQPAYGRWHLRAVHYRVRMSRQDARHTADFLTTAVDTAAGPPRGYAHRVQYTDVLLQNEVAYDSAFWRHYLPPLADANVEEALGRAGAAATGPTGAGSQAGAVASVFEQAQAAAPVPSRWRRGWQGLGRRLRLTYGVGLVPVTTGAGPLAVSYAPAGSRFAAQGGWDLAGGRRGSLLLSFGYELELLPGLSARYASLDVTGDYGQGQAGWQAGLGYAHRLNRRGRPLHLRAGLDYTRRLLGHKLGTFDNPGPGLRLGNQAFDSPRLALALQTRTEALQPKLGVGVELAHHCNWWLDAGYLLPLRDTHTELSLRETSGFFMGRHEAAQRLPAADVQLRVREAPATVAPWAPARLLWQTGLTLRLH